VLQNHVIVVVEEKMKEPVDKEEIKVLGQAEEERGGEGGWCVRGRGTCRRVWLSRRNFL